MADLEHVKGLADLQAFMDQLEPKIERNVAQGALRAGMNVVKPVAQANIHSVSGLLAKGLKVSARARGGVVTATLKATGPHAFIARWLEYGTRPHTITAANRKGLSIGGMFFQSVDHPGGSPHPFMRPALDTQAGKATVAVGEYIKQRLATKHGLDTADIQIEEGEP